MDHLLNHNIWRWFFCKRKNNDCVRLKIEETLKNNENRWRILAYLFNEAELEAYSNADDHAVAIRYNLHNNKIEFVDNIGNIVDYIVKENDKGVEQIELKDFKFIKKKSLSLYICLKKLWILSIDECFLF